MRRSRTVTIFAATLALAACSSTTNAALNQPAKTTATSEAAAPTVPAVATTPSTSAAPTTATPGPSTATSDSNPTLPNLVGQGLVGAQNSAKAAGFTNLTSHDALSSGRVQIIDSNWKVCTQSPAPGPSPVSTTVDFGVVKTDETCPGAPGAAQPQPAASGTVTYVVTGSSADVQYGPAGTNTQGQVPMNVTKPLGSPIYYSITAQLQGSGQVACKLEVNGKAISSSTASGGYNIATCEISQDPLSGNWTDTNQG